MKEADFWSTRLRPRLRAACLEAGLLGHFERVENAVATGTPDVDYCLGGYAGKIENKYAPRHPVRATTPVLGRGEGLRKSQVRWFTKRRLAGGERLFVWIGTPDADWLINVTTFGPERLRELELLAVPHLNALAAWPRAGVRLVDALRWPL